MPACRFCRNNAPLINAHVIPEAFFRQLRHSADVPLVVTGIAGEFPKRRPIGIYDNTILCGSCEAKFSAVDDFGISILLSRFEETFTVVRRGTAIDAYQATCVDQRELLRFLVAVLWRASVSSQPFYKHVTLGLIESQALAAVEQPDAPISPVFAAILTRWVTDEQNRPVAKSLLSPFRERWGIGVNAYRLYLGEMVAFIKVDQQPFPQPLRQYELLAKPELTVIARPLEGSKDLSSMIHVLKQSDKNVRAKRDGYELLRRTKSRVL
jgi:hypothetical protein